MTESERAFLMEGLAASRDTLLSAVEGLSEPQAAFKPSRESWSVLECLEHVAVAERQMLKMIERAQCVSSGPPAAAERDRVILGAALDRSRKFTAPAPSEPRPRFATLREARQEFVDKREQTIAFVEVCTEDLRRRMLLHPLAGRIDAYQCLLLIAAHPSRHAAQIQEIRTRAGFPRS